MAWYKYNKYLKQSKADSYDQTFAGGKSVPHTGIYRCEGCGREIVAVKHEALPNADHHPHTARIGEIVWRLIVFADDRPETER